MMKNIREIVKGQLNLFDTTYEEWAAKRAKEYVIDLKNLINKKVFEKKYLSGEDVSDAVYISNRLVNKNIRKHITSSELSEITPYINYAYYLGIYAGIIKDKESIKQHGLEALNKIKQSSLNESVDKNIKNTLIAIGKNVASKLHCDKSGSCLHFADEFLSEVGLMNIDLLKYFYVVQGGVNVGGASAHHQWIQLKDGTKIDPTFAQFKYNKNATYETWGIHKWEAADLYVERHGYPKFKERLKKEKNSFNKLF